MFFSPANIKRVSELTAFGHCQRLPPGTEMWGISVFRQISFLIHCAVAPVLTLPESWQQKDQCSSGTHSNATNPCNLWHKVPLLYFGTEKDCNVSYWTGCCGSEHRSGRRNNWGRNGQAGGLHLNSQAAAEVYPLSTWRAAKMQNETNWQTRGKLVSTPVPTQTTRILTSFVQAMSLSSGEHQLQFTLC